MLLHFPVHFSAGPQRSVILIINESLHFLSVDVLEHKRLKTVVSFCPSNSSKAIGFAMIENEEKQKFLTFRRVES